MPRTGERLKAKSAETTSSFTASVGLNSYASAIGIPLGSHFLTPCTICFLVNSDTTAYVSGVSKQPIHAQSLHAQPYIVPRSRWINCGGFAEVLRPNRRVLSSASGGTTS